jgi:hypothetical protein
MASQVFPNNEGPRAGTQVFAPDLAVRLICPECKDPNPAIVEEFSSGDLVCGHCGLVLGDRVVDTRSEWRVRASYFCCVVSCLYTPMSRPSPTMKATTLRVSARPRIHLWTE